MTETKQKYEKAFAIHNVISSATKRHGEIFRCQVCGKFIGYGEIPENVKVDFTPDTEFTTEETVFTHKHCL